MNRKKKIDPYQYIVNSAKQTIDFIFPSKSGTNVRSTGAKKTLWRSTSKSKK